MQLTFSTGPDSPSMPSAPRVTTRKRLVAVLAGVVSMHALLAALLLTARNAPVERPIAARPITAVLLSPEAPPARAVLFAPPLPKPQAVTKNKPTPKPATPVAPVARATPPVMAAPATQAAAEHEVPPAQTAAATAPAAAQAGPSTATPAAPAQPGGRETLAIAAPKSVPHVECSIVKPDYPAPSRRRGETGVASVRFVIGVTGAIEQAELVKSSGYARLDEAALAAVRASTCHPYVENGSPLRVANTQPFAFSLDD